MKQIYIWTSYQFFKKIVQTKRYFSNRFFASIKPFSYTCLVSGNMQKSVLFALFIKYKLKAFLYVIHDSGQRRCKRFTSALHEFRDEISIELDVKLSNHTTTGTKISSQFSFGTRRTGLQPSRNYLFMILFKFNISASYQTSATFDPRSLNTQCDMP